MDLEPEVTYMTDYLTLPIFILNILILGALIYVIYRFFRKK